MIGKLTGTRAGAAKGREKMPAGIQDVDAVVVLIGEIDLARINENANGVQELTGTRACAPKGKSEIPGLGACLSESAKAEKRQKSQQGSSNRDLAKE
jgi:hypothetical protein